jgi:hypothetical protein
MRQNWLSEGNTARYLKYGIGEIVLVVIGILIALSINNWNEDRINHKEEALLIKNIVEDLNKDLAHINQGLGELEDQMEVVDDLIAKAMDKDITLDYQFMGLVRYSSDFRPIVQRNHADEVSNLENENTRELLQNYFIKEDQVKDIFQEYETIIHNEVRPYLREAGMHNLESLYTREGAAKIEMLLKPEILDAELQKVKFQQILFERRLKTEPFKRFLNELKVANQDLVKALKFDLN